VVGLKLGVCLCGAAGVLCCGPIYHVLHSFVTAPPIVGCPSKIWRPSEVVSSPFNEYWPPLTQLVCLFKYALPLPSDILFWWGLSYIPLRCTSFIVPAVSCAEVWTLATRPCVSTALWLVRVLGAILLCLLQGYVYLVSCGASLTRYNMFGAAMKVLYSAPSLLVLWVSFITYDHRVVYFSASCLISSAACSSR